MRFWHLFNHHSDVSKDFTTMIGGKQPLVKCNSEIIIKTCNSDILQKDTLYSYYKKILIEENTVVDVISQVF